MKPRAKRDTAERLRSYMALAACAVCAAVGLNLLFGLLQPEKLSDAYRQASERQYAVSVLKGLFLYGLFYPAVEEAVFRGAVLGLFRRLFQTRTAVLLSALLFGLYHGNIVQGVYAFLLGLLLAYGRLRMDTPAAPFLMHAAANCCVFLLSGRAFFESAPKKLAGGVIFLAAAGICLWREAGAGMPGVGGGAEGRKNK